MKLLLIEDDHETALYLSKGLRQAGHVVDVVGDGRDGLFLASSEVFDILIVDRRLPTIDGLSIVQTLRGAGSTVPILFLTTMSSVDARVEGLEAGGDDYLVKPFAFSELMARLNALSRRPPITHDDSCLRVGVLEMDFIRRTVKRSGQVLDLQPLEFRLLEYFLRHEGRIVTRTMLLERVWEFHFDPKTKVIEANISRLRAKLDKPFDRPLLHTARGAGYVLRADGGSN